MTAILSPKNSFLQEVRRAASAGRPTEDGLIVAEGPHLAEEALRGSWPLEQVLVAEAFRPVYTDLLRRTRADIVEVSDRAFAATATTRAHQGIITLLQPRRWTWGDLTRSQPLLVVFDEIQDPGNAGALVRSAEAFGATGVIFLRGSVRVSNGKLLRAAAGSAFRVPFLEDLASEELLGLAGNTCVALHALAADAQVDLSEADFRGASALILGSEGGGISALLRRRAAGLRIPVQAVESLNVGIAGSIALFEAARQRRSRE